MILYALKSDEGYLKLAENRGFDLVGLNKASVYDEGHLDQLRTMKGSLMAETVNLRIVKMTLEETDYFE
jgi:hypothetical protein